MTAGQCSLRAIAFIAAAICGTLCLAAPPENIWSADRLPITGEMLPAGEGLQQIDGVMKEILVRHEVPGAALAITYQGRLIVARGYGWADIQADQPVRQETLFGLASVSKSITAVTVLKLVQEGHLRLDERVFELLGDLRAPPEHTLDPRLREITIRMLLEHAGGWDRTKSGDPTGFGERVHNELKVPLPVSIDELIYYMNGEPLDFAPGTEQRYSNYGFAILGRVIEHVTGEHYVEYVEKNTLEPMGIRGIKMSSGGRPDKEVGYLPDEAKRYVAGTTKALELGKNPAAAPAGGWYGSAVALARFMTAVDGTRTGKQFLGSGVMKQMLARPQVPLEVRKNGSWFGLGWDAVREMPDWPYGQEHESQLKNQPSENGDSLVDKMHGAGSGGDQSGIDNLAYGKDGGLPGISTWVQHLPGGIDWVVLFNGSKHKPEHPEEAERPSEAPQGNALQDAQKSIVNLLRDVKRWPSGDLFEKYR